MVLAISVIRHADEHFANPVTTPLAAARCTIGRGQECDIVLEDPTRHVSRRHATIVRQGERYFLTVESRINPVILNGQPVAAGQQAAVNPGDRMVIGEYEFNVVTAPAGSAQGTQASDPLAALGGTPAGPVDLDALFGPTPTARAPAAPAPSPGLDALFGGAGERAPDPLLDILGGGSANRGASPAPPEPHADDPLMRILGAEASSGTPSGRGGADDLLHGSGPASSIDDLLGAGTAASSDPLGLAPEVPRTRTDGAFGGGRGGSLELDHVHDIHLPLSMPTRGAPAVTPAPPAPVEHGAPLVSPPPAESRPTSAEPDPLSALFGPASGAVAPSQDPLGLFGPQESKGSAPADSFPELLRNEELTGISPFLPAEQPVPEAPPARVETASRAQASPARQPPRPAPAASAAPVPIGPPGSMQGAIRAFLEGAGMTDIEIAEADADQFIRECGGTVRAAVEGIMGMLLARAKVKEELRASDRTMVASKENNALKLIESVDEALRYVFDPATRTDAFLPPPKAVADACSDLQAHEIALVAGMRSALIGAIKLFQPAAIEKKLEKAGGKSLLANKKALLWEQFVAHYDELEKDAEDNFDRVFGAAFLRAYQEQVRRLRG